MEIVNKQVFNRNTIKYNPLNKQEVYFLRLYSHNYTNKSIAIFLGMHLKSLGELEKSIALKLSCKTIEMAVLRAFELGILNHYDYISPNVKEVAIDFSREIFNYSKQSLSTGYLKEMLNRFLIASELKLEYYGVRLDLIEIRVIEFKFKGYSDSSIIETLKLSNNYYISTQMRIAKKFGSHNWYTIFKRSFELNILNKSDYSGLDMYSETMDCALRLISIIKQNSEAKYKELLIYYEIIGLYSHSIFSCISTYKEII